MNSYTQRSSGEHMCGVIPEDLGQLISEELQGRIEEFRNAPGEEFEAILDDALDEIDERYGRDRKWFDHRLSNRDGLEAKTFQCSSSSNVGPGSSVQNVLKRARLNRVIPRHLIQRGMSLNTYMTAEIAASHLHNFFCESIDEHATAKGITGERHMITMLRNNNLTSIGVWVENLDEFIDELFDDDVVWSWDYNESSMVETLVGRRNGNVVLRWYWEAAFHVNVQYTAPATADFFHW